MERNRIDDVLQGEAHYAEYAPIDARQNTHYHQVASPERSDRSLRHPQPDTNYVYQEDNVV